MALGNHELDLGDQCMVTSMGELLTPRILRAGDDARRAPAESEAIWMVT
jgi:hypothetical protein